jgi:hypothetical protein
VAEEFDRIHDVHRAKSVGSLDEIVSPARLRSFLFDSLERGMKRVLDARVEPAA